LNIVESFLNHDYTEEDEKDEFKVSLFHLIHLLQCNHGSETIQQIISIEFLFFRYINIMPFGQFFLFHEYLSAENKLPMK